MPDKRPSTVVTPPPSKRQERPSSYSLPSLDAAAVNKIITGLREAVKNVPNGEEDGEELRYELYLSVRCAFSSFEEAKDKGLVSIKQFMRNIDQQPQFFEVLKRGIVDSASQADIEAVVFHSKCFCNA
jgi:hypothetical protein